jgi:hypothetical protein
MVRYSSLVSIGRGWLVVDEPDFFETTGSSGASPETTASCVSQNNKSQKKDRYSLAQSIVAVYGSAAIDSTRHPKVAVALSSPGNFFVAASMKAEPLKLSQSRARLGAGMSVRLDHHCGSLGDWLTDLTVDLAPVAEEKVHLNLEPSIFSLALDLVLC